MLTTRKTFAILALAATVTGGGALLGTSPAMAQGEDRLEVFGPGERGWFDGRPEVFGEGRRGWFEERDREAFERGYRMGRDDERRAADTAARRDFSEAREYLGSARRRVSEGDLRDAWVALGRAETRLLTRASTMGGPEAATGGAIGAIRDARRALQDRELGLARERIARAEAMIERGIIVGRTVSGDRLAGAGLDGADEPLSGSGGRSAAGGGRGR